MGVNRDNHRSGLLGEPTSSVLVKVPGRASRDLFRVVDGFFDEVEELFVVIWEDVGWDRVNCQLYRGWRLGKRKPGVIPKGEELVEAEGESTEIRNERRYGGVGVGSCDGDRASVVDLCDEALWEETVGVSEGGSSYVREGGSYSVCKGVGSGVGSSGEETS